MKHREKKTDNKNNRVLVTPKQPNTDIQSQTHTQLETQKKKGTEKYVNSSKILPKLVKARHPQI